MDSFLIVGVKKSNNTSQAPGLQIYDFLLGITKNI